jgi:hypothetical protein
VRYSSRPKQTLRPAAMPSTSSRCRNRRRLRSGPAIFIDHRTIVADAGQLRFV